MSKGARITLGIAALLIGVCFAYMAPTLGQNTPVGPLPFFGLALFCGAIALACFVKSCRGLALRFIGAVVLLSFLAYAIGEFGEDGFGKAVLGLVVFGLPSGYIAVTGKYPKWGVVSEVFNPEPERGPPKK
jgi:hypothetical protein